MVRCTQEIVNRTGWHSHQCKKEGILEYEREMYCDEHYPPHADKETEMLNTRIKKNEAITEKSEAGVSNTIISLIEEVKKELGKIESAESRSKWVASLIRLLTKKINKELDELAEKKK